MLLYDNAILNIKMLPVSNETIETLTIMYRLVQYIHRHKTTVIVAVCTLLFLLFVGIILLLFQGDIKESFCTVSS